MIQRSVLLVICSLCVANCRIIEFGVSPPRSGGCSYEIGEPVALTCRVEDDSELSVMFRHGTYKAENGISHFPKYVADKVARNRHVHHSLTVKRLQWEDHGLWECVQGGAAWNVTIDITVLGSVQPLRASLVPAPAGGAASGPDIHRQRGSIEDPVESAPRLLYGKGTKTNPFDLTGGAQVRLDCVTGCSFPPTRHHWKFTNHSAAPESVIDSSASTERGNCSVPDEVSGVSTRSSLLVSCLAFPALVGSNEVSCSMLQESPCHSPAAGPSAGNNEVPQQAQRTRHRQRSVYVLCPGGHRPWTLTNGEIVGLSIAVGLTALMLVMFFMSAKKIVNSYRYGSVVKGIRV